MREIALHILDLVENSLRAQATTIAVAIAADPLRDRLEVVVEDNGGGLKVSGDKAADPFYTTKAGKRTGLGLSLFRQTAEQAGGGLTIGQSQLGGVRVEVDMALGHVDRVPLGDLAGTLAGLVLTNPELDFRFELTFAGQAGHICTAELADGGHSAGRGALALAQQVRQMIQTELDRAADLTGLAL